MKFTQSQQYYLDGRKIWKRSHVFKRPRNTKGTFQFKYSWVSLKSNKNKPVTPNKIVSFFNLFKIWKWFFDSQGYAFYFRRKKNVQGIFISTWIIMLYPFFLTPKIKKNYVFLGIKREHSHIEKKIWRQQIPVLFKSLIKCEKNDISLQRQAYQCVSQGATTGERK